MALELADDAGQKFAYVPDCLASEVGRDPGTMVVSVERINPDPAHVHHRVLCRFWFPKEQGRELFAGEDYRPISADASGVAA